MTQAIPRLIAAAPVSFTSEDELDDSGTTRIFESVANSVGDALVLGTTGEFPALRSTERRRIMEHALDILGPERAIIHIGYPSLHQIRRDLEHALACGTRRIALLTPYYLPVGQIEIVKFYESVARELDDTHELYAYVFEQRSGVDITPETVARIAEIPRLVGIKVSGKSLPEIAEMQRAAPESFQFFTGADDDILAGHRQGLKGVVSGVSSALPKPFQSLIEAIEADDASAIAKFDRATSDIVTLFAGRIAAIKHVLQLRGIANERMRMPSDALDPDSKVALARIVEEWT